MRIGNIFQRPMAWVAILMLGLTSHAVAQTTYYVDPAAPDNTGDGLTWETARPGISNIYGSFTLAPGDQIYVKAGPLVDNNLHVTTDDISLYGGFNISLTGTNGDPAVDRFADGLTVMDANGGSRIVMVRAGAGQRWDGFSFENAATEVAFWVRDDFGAVPAGLVIANCEFRNNVVATGTPLGSAYEGAAFGVSLLDASVSPADFNITIENSLFENNVNANDTFYLYGGAIATEGNITVTNCQFIGNKVDRLNDDNWGSEASNGGGIALLGAAAVIDKCIFDGNIVGGSGANNGGGSGVYLASTDHGVAEATITNSLFANNSSGSDGARGSVFAQDSADGNLGTSVGDPLFVIQNCTFDNNTADGFGAADVHQTLISSTNVIENCIFSNITGNAIREQVNTGVINTDSILLHNNSGGILGTVNQTNTLSGNPNYQNPAASNYRIDDTSPAYDAGKTIAGINDDIDGDPRPSGIAFDIGYDEFVPGSTLPPDFITGPYTTGTIALQGYSLEIIEGVDFLDPEGDRVVISIGTHTGPGTGAWLSVDETTSGSWTVSGTPLSTDAGQHVFVLLATAVDGAGSTTVELDVQASDFPPTWSEPTLDGGRVAIGESFATQFVRGVDFDDLNTQQALTLAVESYDGGPSGTATDWLTLSDQGGGTWLVEAGPAPSDLGLHSWTLSVSDGVNAPVQVPLQLNVVSGTVYYVRPRIEVADGLTTDGLSWPTAFDSISSATEIVQPGDEIWISSGTLFQVYFDVPNGVSMYGGFKGDEPITYNLNNRDFVNNATIFDGNNINGEVINIEGDIGVRFDGFTVRNGDSTNLPGGLRIRDMRASNATLSRPAGSPPENIVIANVVVENNNAAFGPGGVHVFSANSTADLNILFDNVTIRNNTRGGSAQNFGCGLGVRGINGITFRKCRIENNFYDVGSGGATARGGGVSIEDSTDVLFERCFIEDNSVLDGVFNDSKGGGMHIIDSIVEVRNCVFSGNAADGDGNAIHVDANDDTPVASKLILTNCTIDSNLAINDDATTKAAVSIDAAIGHEITNVVFSSNNQIALRMTAGTSATLNSLFFFEHDLNLSGDGVFDSPQSNIIESTEAPGYQGSTINPANPYDLTLDSPLREAGTDLGAPPIDILGRARPYGPLFDIGAYEGVNPMNAVLNWAIYE